MIPKKIYLNYVNEDDKEKTWSEEPVSVNDCDMQNREYTDLSQVWHDASEIPQENHKNIIYQTNYYSMYNVHIDFIPTCLRSCKITQKGWKEFVGENNVKRWAYVNDLLPKGGEE